MYRNIRQFPELKDMSPEDRRIVLTHFVQKSRSAVWASGLLLFSVIISFVLVRWLLPGQSIYMRVAANLLVVLLTGYVPYLYVLNNVVRRDFEREFPGIKREIGMR